MYHPISTSQAYVLPTPNDMQDDICIEFGVLVMIRDFLGEMGVIKTRNVLVKCLKIVKYTHFVLALLLTVMKWRENK